MKNLRKNISFVMIIFCINSLLYYQISDNMNDNDIFNTISEDIESNNQEDIEEIPDNTISNTLVKKTTIPGQYRVKGMFTHDSNVTFDQDGEVLVLEDFEDMKDLSIFTDEKRFKMYNDSITWPSANDVYQPLSESNYTFTNSSMFTSSFEYDTLISGKVYFLTHMNTLMSASLNFTFRISLYIFDPLNSNKTEILSYEEQIFSGLKKGDQKIFSPQLNDTYLIPANNRLNLRLEGKVSDITENPKIDLYSSTAGPSAYQWIINDGEYSHTYDFTQYSYVLGMQIKYRSIKYPSIYVLGVNNQTYYTEPTNVTINILNATEGHFRWDSDSFTLFENTAETSIPLTDAWHYLEIQAHDEFNNTRIAVYELGYDPETSYLILNNPTNESIVQGGSLLNFSMTGFDSASYEWDKNGTLFDLLLAPEYDIYAPSGDGWHNLTFYLSDIFISEEHFFRFRIDSLPPLITLNNVINNTKQPANKLIKVKIIDSSLISSVEYKWDNNVLLPWSPSKPEIYYAYLPESSGIHTLTVIAEDELSYSDTKLFAFNVSEDLLLVELRSMVNESWHYGGEEVDVTISGFNGTVLFKWDNSAFQNGTPYLTLESYLHLNGSNVLPPDPNFYHYLTIKVGDTDDIERIFIFEFRIDQENPVIDSSIDNYNNERFKTTDILSFNLTDNATISSELSVLISIDGNDDITLSVPYELILNTFSDGMHTFTLNLTDIAGNSVVKTITFYVDTHGPDIEITSIEGLVILLDGTQMVPYNSTVTINITEDDPVYNTYYSWSDSNYTLFTDSFALNFSDGSGVLKIYANDSLGNYNLIERNLIIDGTGPIVTLEFPFVNSTINGETQLRFNIEDLSPLSIKTIELSWDAIVGIFGPTWISESIFSIPFPELYYSTGETAKLTIYAEDFAGNYLNYTFDFIVDVENPITEVYYYNTEISSYSPIINGTYYHGNTTLWFTNTSSDLLFFYISWDYGEYLLIGDPWLDKIPFEDGVHILDILLYDSTGEGTSPNAFEQRYILKVDDIHIDYITPTTLNDTAIPFNLEYKEIFNFTIEVSDFVEDTAVLGLNSSIVANDLDLDVTWINDSRIFQFSINATNVTPLGSSVSIVQIEFSVNGTNAHLVQLNLFVERKDETTLDVTEDSILSVKWEDSLTIEFTLQDEFDNYLIDILQIDVNGDIISEYSLVDIDTIGFNYSSKNFNSKGTFDANITVFSTYYKGQILKNITIQPLELVLDFEVSNIEIIVETSLIMTATLTYLNGTGLEGVVIKFTVFVFYDQVGVSALIEGSDYNETLEDATDAQGSASKDFLMTSEIDHVRISVSFDGNSYTEIKYLEFEESIKTITSGIPPYILYPVIAGSILFLAFVVYIIVKLTREKPFSKLMEKVTEEEITENLIRINPGVVLVFFDQRKGPVPMVHDHNIETHCRDRLSFGVDNFIIKVSDQAISSLGFEDKDEGRRRGSILLPSEGLIGALYGFLIKNEAARGGFENLALIILLDEKYDERFAANHSYIFDTVDQLENNLNQRRPLVEIRQSLALIRRQAAKIVLAGLMQKKE